MTSSSYSLETNMTYLLEDVMVNKFDKAFHPKDLWNYVENKKGVVYKMEDVKHWVYFPCWSRTGADNKECYYSIYQVFMQQDEFSSDIKRIKEADLSYPIIVIEDTFDKYGTILDGNHRFAKMVKKGFKNFLVKFVTRKEIMKLMINVND